MWSDPMMYGNMWEWGFLSFSPWCGELLIYNLESHIRTAWYLVHESELGRESDPNLLETFKLWRYRLQLKGLCISEIWGLPILLLTLVCLWTLSGCTCCSGLILLLTGGGLLTGFQSSCEVISVLRKPYNAALSMCDSAVVVYCTLAINGVKGNHTGHIVGFTITTFMLSVRSIMLVTVPTFIAVETDVVPSLGSCQYLAQHSWNMFTI